MKFTINVVLLFFLSAFTFGQNDFTVALEKANSLYDSKEYEVAKSWYQIAAEKGSADANFYLAYRYKNPIEKTKSYYITAARLGHAEALDKALDLLFFRARGLVSVDAKLALELYKEVKEMYPSINFYAEDDQVETLEIAASIPDLDAKAFIDKYKLSEDENFESIYYIWELAEAASRGERFENSSSELVMQLIIRGGIVPWEIYGAIQDYYSLMNTSDSLVEFRICDYVTSGMGLAYCAQKKEVEEQKIAKSKIEQLKVSLGLKNDLLDSAYIATMRFLDAKVWNEEGHGGSGYRAWGQSSLSDQRDSYFEFLSSARYGLLQDSVKPLSENDKQLNIKYKEIRSELKENPIYSNWFTIDSEGFRKTQRLWLKFRDANTALLIAITDETNKDFWYNYFTIERLEQFESLKERISWE